MFLRSFVGVDNFICGSVDYPIVVSELWPRAHKGSRYRCLTKKINFMIWQNTIQDLLVQQGLDQALEDERPVSINETE